MATVLEELRHKLSHLETSVRINHLLPAYKTNGALYTSYLYRKEVEQRILRKAIQDVKEKIKEEEKKITISKTIVHMEQQHPKKYPDLNSIFDSLTKIDETQVLSECDAINDHESSIENPDDCTLCTHSEANLLSHTRLSKNF